MAEELVSKGEDDLKSFYRTLSSANFKETNKLKEAELGKSDDGYDGVAKAIYQQAQDHRDRLIKFYIHYTVWFSIVVGLITISQSIFRVLLPQSNFEIMPRWTMNILIAGMFAQFISLLKIVTKNAWDYKSFFNHHNSLKSGKSE